MKYIPLPITEKVENIKADYLKSPVANETNPYAERVYKKLNSGDRWLTLGFLEGWLKHENAPTTFRRRAYAEAEELYAAKPIITEHELITGQPYVPEYSPEQKARYLELYEMFHMSSVTTVTIGPRADHISLDLDKLLRVGVGGLIAEIRAKIGELDADNRSIYPDLTVIEQLDYYESCLIELNAVLDLAKRYSAEARRLAENVSTSRKSELIRISDALERVPEKPAESFFEAIQSVQFFLGIQFGLYPLNRPDRYLYKFYEEDLESGKISRAEAQELIDNFCLAVSTRIFTRAACGFIVGGRDADGRLVENDLTYMFLTALDHIRMPDPNGALAVCSDTSDEILRYSAEILSRGVTHPAFYNDEMIVSSLERLGVTHEDAVNYIHTTCAEISVVGKSKVYTTPIIVNMPATLMNSVWRLPDGTSFDEIKTRFSERIYESLRRDTRWYLTKILESRRNACDPLRASCLIDDCIARGRSYWNGGERYAFIEPTFIGIGTVVDSLIAIKHLVYDEKRLTLSELREIVISDFKDNEPLRQYIIHKLPHFGNDSDEPDSLAKWLYGEIERITQTGNISAGHMLVPGTFSYIIHALSGANDGASFDGRRAHAAYSDGCCPVQGRDTSGPTATVLSLTNYDQSSFLGGMVVNMKYSPKHLTGNYVDSFIKVLRAFIERGGIEMQVNVVDRETLIDAQKNPDAHGDLIVRIGGFSDYFVRLTKTLQNELIERSEH